MFAYIIMLGNRKKETKKKVINHDDDISSGSNDSNENLNLTPQQKQNKHPVDNTDNVSVVVSSSGNTKQVEWSPENEEIMIEWCDIAQCYKWLNARSYSKYSYKNAWFTIPAIVLSTISGTASFAQTSLPQQYQVYSPMAIGAINIFIGILTTIHQYLKISELTEAHRVSAISWDKYARNIRIELAKKPEERMDASHFLKLSRQEFDRLMETSPMINDNVIAEFNKTFIGKPGSVEQERFNALKKPDICNTIVSANETRHKWYLDADKQQLNQPILPTSTLASPSIIEELNKYKTELISMQKKHISEKTMEMERIAEESRKANESQQQERARLEREAKETEARYISSREPILNYIKKFEELYSRKPLHDEIVTNLRDEIESSVLDRFLDSYRSVSGSAENV